MGAVTDPKCDQCGKNNPTVSPRCLIDYPGGSRVVLQCNHCWQEVFQAFGKWGHGQKD